MKQKNLTDVCVISEDPFFINRLKIFNQTTKISFEYNNNPNNRSGPDLFIVDINLLEVFLENNNNPSSPKFIVHGEQKDLKIAFKAGCTDFLKEPWNNDELEARILKALDSKKNLVHWNKLTLSQKSISTGSHSVNISIEEYKILKKLIENSKEAVPREALLYALGGRKNIDSRAADMHISNLRKKIEFLKKIDSTCCGEITTIRSYGYMII